MVPDLAAFGKVLAGGFPLAARGRTARRSCATSTPRCEGSPDYVWQAGTLNGNPVAASAGLATLAELRKPGAYERLFAHRHAAARGSGRRRAASTACRRR